MPLLLLLLFATLPLCSSSHVDLLLNCRLEQFPWLRFGASNSPLAAINVTVRAGAVVAVATACEWSYWDANDQGSSKTRDTTRKSDAGEKRADLPIMGVRPPNVTLEGTFERLDQSGLRFQFCIKGKRQCNEC